MRMKKQIRKLGFDLGVVLAILVILTMQGGVQTVGAASLNLKSHDSQNSVASGGCHFAITVPDGITNYDLSSIGVGSYLDWGINRNRSVASNIGYSRVILVDNKSYTQSALTLPTKLSANPGAVWIIGNEPDSEVSYQDHVTAETYAERFFTLATAIRQSDPTAKIGFGTVIMPTPVRLFYLDKVITRLTQLAGDRATALALIDIYSIHAFLLNEEPLYNDAGQNVSWGAGVPLGYDAATWPKPEVLDGSQTIDITKFQARIIAFRQWMQKLGQQNKPLWITEYGSLLPTFLNISDEESAAYMEQTFNFMLGTKDAALGYAGDDNRLVQKWYWYSLNGRVDHFGGSLYDPLTLNLTAVGEHFISYNPSLAAVPVVDPDVYVESNLVIIPGLAGDITVRVKVGNTVISDRLTGVNVELTIDGNVIGSVPLDIPRCGGVGTASFTLKNVLEMGKTYTASARVEPAAGNGVDINPVNDSVIFAQITIPHYTFMSLPLMLK